MLQIRNHQKRPNINQYYSPYSHNLLYRFPIEHPASLKDSGPTVIYNLGGEEYARKYFWSSLQLKKLRVRLLDNKGYPVDLNNGDITLSLILKRLYQY